MPVREARINHGDLDTVGEKQHCARLVGIVSGQPPCNMVMCQDRIFSRRTAWRLSPATSAKSHPSGRMEPPSVACMGFVLCCRGIPWDQDVQRLTSPRWTVFLLCSLGMLRSGSNDVENALKNDCISSAWCLFCMSEGFLWWLRERKGS